MPLDYKLALVGAVVTALRANSGVTNTFKRGNIHDERTDGAIRRQLTTRSVQDFPSIDVEVGTGDEQQTRTPSFGLTGTASPTCDAIVPVSVVLVITMRFAVESLALGRQTAAETYVRQALHQAYPKLGLIYVRDFTIRERRGRPPQTEETVQSTVAVKEVVWEMNIALRLHISQLRD